MFDEISKIVGETVRHGAPAIDDNATPRALRIHPDDLFLVCQRLYQDPKTYLDQFDQLSSITAIDNGPDAGTLEIAYNLYSIPFNLHVMLKISMPRDNAEVVSLVPIWRTANWHEREVFDMFGVTFRNHPDLRRILLPADWEGHPLRKDYKQQEYYKGIKVEF
jgi:NADH-quinone oxidoreductase subunit C